MTLRCKAGDLAVIVQSVSGINLGKVVEVIEPWNDEGALTVWWRRAGFVLKVRSRGSAINYGDGVVLSMVGPAPDSWLRPIRPDAEPESIVRELETT